MPLVRMIEKTLAESVLDMVAAINKAIQMETVATAWSQPKIQ